MKRITIAGMILAVYAMAAYSTVKPVVRNVNPLLAECIVNTTLTAVIPLSGTGYITVNARWLIYNVTGAYVESASGYQVFKPITETPRYYQELSYKPSIVGTIVLSVTDTISDEEGLWTTSVVSPETIRESTMYYLIASIARSPTATWTAPDAIIRSCSAYYDSALVEVYVDDQGKDSDYHVVIYDYSSRIENYVQRKWEFWVSTPAEVHTILGRAVPDADVTRYKIQLVLE